MKIKTVFVSKLLFIALSIALLNSCSLISTDNSIAVFHIDVETQELNFGDYIKGNVSYYDSTGLLVLEDITTSIKYRGNASAHFDKKSLSLKFPDKEKFGDSKKSDSWKLNAEYVDKTFQRNKLSYDLFRSFSKGNYAPGITYVEVYLNGKYNGIYALTEKVDEEKLNLKKKNKGAVIFKQPPISNPPEVHTQKYEGMVNYSRSAKFYEGFSESAMDKLIREAYYNQRFPNINKANKNYLIHEITDFIINSDDIEFSNAESFNEYFDLDNIIDWHILLLLTNNADGLLKNFYLSRKKEGEPFLFSPWDFDHSFGRDGDGEISKLSHLDVSRMNLLQRLLETDAFNYNLKIYQKFMQLKDAGILTKDNIIKMIDSNTHLINDAIVRNEERWPVNESEFFDDEDYFSEVRMMKDWISMQLVSVETYLAILTNARNE